MTIDILMDKLLKEVRTVAVVCNQWGDTGKGKIVDVLAEWADVIARGTGGNNAGHTTVVNGKERIFHLVPAGINYDSEGKINILGNGMVIDISVLCSELDDLDKEGISHNNLMISKDAHVIMPYHLTRDAGSKSQKDGGIGTTGRGIGPCYTDKIARRGITISMLYDQDKLAKSIDRVKPYYPEQKIDTEEIISSLKPFAERIWDYVADTINEMHNFMIEGKKILLEGAQGLLLSIEYGTYPYVTSSDCSINGTAAGVGLSAKAIDLPLGVVKFPFMTRVGAGPFPTELGGKKSEEYCSHGREHDVFYEARTYLGMELDLDMVRKLQEKEEHKGLTLDERMEFELIKKQTKQYISENRNKILEMIGIDDEFIQGIGIRLAAGEYGATTGRPRRVGWTDAVAAKYAIGINGMHIVLTKVDSLTGIDKFGICYGYGMCSGFNKESGQISQVSPGILNYSGYRLDNFRAEHGYDRLPEVLKQAINDFETFTSGVVRMISTGAERDQIIVK